MTLDDGVLKVCTLENKIESGKKPQEVLKPITKEMYFGLKTIGYQRAYLAHGVNRSIDLIVRVFYNPKIKDGMYAVLSYCDDNGQYMIDRIERRTDDDGEKVVDLTLVKLEDLYDVYEFN